MLKTVMSVMSLESLLRYAMTEKEPKMTFGEI